MEVYVNELTLDLEAVEHFPSGFNSLAIPILCDVGKEAEVKRGSFGPFEKGRPTFSLAAPMALQILGINCNLVPVATYKQKTEWSVFRCTMRVGGPHSLHSRRKMASRTSKGIRNTGRRELWAVFLIESHGRSPLIAICLRIEQPTRLLVLVKRVKEKHTPMG